MTSKSKTSDLKSYPTPWKGEVILACKRCQKKLHKSGNSPAFARLRKWTKAAVRKGKIAAPIHLVDIPCQDICPKNAIVVCTASQLSSQPPRFSIISSGLQMRQLCESITTQRRNA